MSAWPRPTTADVGLRAFARSPSRVFDEATMGMQNILISEASVGLLRGELRGCGKARGGRAGARRRNAARRPGDRGGALPRRLRGGRLPTPEPGPRADRGAGRSGDCRLA